MKVPGLVLFLLLALWAKYAHAYATYVRLGYVSCASCHTDPMGSGMLTPYGEGIQAAMAAFPEDLTPSEQKFYQGAQVRVLESNNATNQANPFLMQSDYLGTAYINQSVYVDAEVGPNLQRGATGTFVSLPDTTQSAWNAVVLRRALITDNLSDASTLELGRDYPVAGLNIDDHTAFIRSTNRDSFLDYPTQLRYIYQGEQLQLVPYLLAPSYEEANNDQEYGAGFRSEYALSMTNSVGVTALYGNTASLSRVQAGTFFRLSHDHWNGFIGEYDYTHWNIHSTQESFDQHNIYLKPYIAIPEWLETGVVYEFYATTSPFYQNSFDYGPEINARIQRFVSVLAGAKNIGISGNTTWSLYGQLFLHVEI